MRCRVRCGALRRSGRARTLPARRPRPRRSRRRCRRRARQLRAPAPPSRCRTRHRAVSVVAARARTASGASVGASSVRAPVMPVTVTRYSQPSVDSAARRSRSSVDVGATSWTRRVSGRTSLGRSATINDVAPALCRVGGEPFPTVGVEDRRVGHRDQRHGDALACLREHLEALLRAHPRGERPLAGPADHRPVGERIGEREAELDDVCSRLDGRLRERRACSGIAIR